MMKRSVSIVIVILILVPWLVSSRHMSRPHPHHGHDRHSLRNNKPNKTRDDDVAKSGTEGGVAVTRRGADTVQVAGSRLPDCTHACGSCKPCRLVMVSFVCASLEEAETCPMAYKCMCKNKSYPIP